MDNRLTRRLGGLLYRLTGIDLVPLSGPRCPRGKCRARALVNPGSDNMEQCAYCGLPVCAVCGTTPVGEWPADSACPRCASNAAAEAAAEREWTERTGRDPVEGE
jgi:hypothetical protein